MIECSVLRDNDPRWDAFVLAHPAGTFFHLSIWREIVSRSFGYEPIYLYATDSDRICGVLPLFLVKSLLFGRSLVAMPVSVYGGAITTDVSTAGILLDEAKRRAKEQRVRYLEIRGNPHGENLCVPDSNGEAAGWSRKDLYVTFLSEISPTDEANLARIPRKQRRMVRQGDKNGLRPVFDNGRLPEFYNVYAESVRNLGTPVFGFSYFKNLVEALGEQCKVLLIEYQDKVVAGVLSFFYKDQVLPYYGGALKGCLHLAPSDFMYWELMRYAASHGYKVFDFGRSKEGTGSYHFKRHWGFEPKPLAYWYYSLNGHGIPDTSSVNPKLQWAIRMWRGLPLRVTKSIGPYFVRHIVP
jgi:FemAB-related protein (PEP-CTERM system-associated)